MTTLILGECSQGQLLEPTRRLVQAARDFKAPIHILIHDNEQCGAVNEAACLLGVERVFYASQPAPDLVGLDHAAALAQECAADYDVIVAANAGTGKHVLPLLAARLQIVPLTGVSAILGDNVFERPIHAGSLNEQVKLTTAKILLTIKTANFAPVGDQPPCPVEIVSASPADNSAQLVSYTPQNTERADLASADIVIAGGRGLGSKENFTALGSLADELGAALGASRVAVDMGWAPHKDQVGQTGVQISPKLYIALGISGAVQHLAGIKDAGTIVAINKDGEADIFGLADYGIIGDLHELLPHLKKAVTKGN